jgi:hypothetical protein
MNTLQTIVPQHLTQQVLMHLTQQVLMHLTQQVLMHLTQQVLMHLTQQVLMHLTQQVLMHLTQQVLMHLTRRMEVQKLVSKQKVPLLWATMARSRPELLWEVRFPFIGVRRGVSKGVEESRRLPA